MNISTSGTGRKVWCDQGMRGWSQRPIETPSVGISGCNRMWKAEGQHPFLNISTSGTGRKVWCDQGTRSWSHRPIQTTYVGISGCNNAKSGGPTSIPPHNPQQFHSWNRTESLVWSGHEFWWDLFLLFGPLHKKYQESARGACGEVDVIGMIAHSITKNLCKLCTLAKKYEERMSQKVRRSLTILPGHRWHMMMIAATLKLFKLCVKIAYFGWRFVHKGF